MRKIPLQRSLALICLLVAASTPRARAQQPFFTDNADVADAKSDAPEVKYTTDFYISQLPKTQVEADSLAKERNFAYYQLGVIYKEKFKEYQRAADKLEKLLDSQPEERLVLPSMYHLYKIYEIIDKDKATAMKA